ncbi:probable helicase senataxin [Bufo gargarizans]|uniref:probable helicase senataxin n=1 Tax=Bufo gargarizans TaxID=30331 RepID=UPI001CF3B2B4|nr:probable helicase senataxin [Bufo gargarizans]
MSTCRWCTPGAPVSAELLTSYAARKLQSDDLIGANDDLSYCMECVAEYHRVREQAPHLHKALWKMETARITAHLEKSLREEIEDDEVLLVEEDGEKQLFGYAGLESNVRVPLLEILKYPYLLLDRRVCELCVDALCKMETVNNPFQVYEKVPGIYLLLVHPNENIRRWAILTARAQGKVDRDDYYDLQEVFTCLFKFIELGLFESPDIYSSSEVEDGKLILLPAHLYDTTNYKNYWLGVCMLLTVLEEEAMDSLLLGPDKQNDFMQSILYMMEKRTDDESTNPFWPALHCFMIILDRLGSKVWGQLIDPIQAFQTIISSPSYNNEIENIRKSCQRLAKDHPDPEDDDDDDLVSCSQMVYNFNSEKPKKDTGWKSAICPDYCPNMYDDMQSLANILQSDTGQDMRVHNSTFLWFIPYVQSVMDLKDLGVAYIMEVIHHLYSEIKEALSQRSRPCDKVSELFIRVLVSIIELHRSKKCLHLLWVSSHKWVEALIKGSLIPTKDMAARPNSRITSTTSPLSSSPNSQAPSSVQFACIQLIRSLLREGYQLGQNSTCKQYLDKLNLVIRGNALWNLESDIQGLQNCLIEIIKVIKNRTSMAPNSALEQTTMSKVQSVPFIKTERIDEDEDWYGCTSSSPLPSLDVPPVTIRSGCSTGSPLPSPDIQPTVTSKPSQHGAEGLLFPIKKEPQEVQAKGSSLHGSVLKTNLKKQPFNEIGQENTQCKEKPVGWKSKLSEVMAKSSNRICKKEPSASESNVSSSSEAPSALKPCYVRIKKEPDLWQTAKSCNGSDANEESDDVDDDIPLIQVRKSLHEKTKGSAADNLAVSERLRRLTLENDRASNLVKREPSNEEAEYNDCVMEGEGEDDLPLSEIKKRLLLKKGKKLAGSMVDRDLPRSAAQESTPCQEFGLIERKVKETRRSLPSDNSSDPIIILSDDSSDEEQKDFLKFVKTEKRESGQEARSSSSAKFMKTKSAQIKQEPAIEVVDEYNSQCFEFETEDEIYSAWEDPQLQEEKPDLLSKCKKTETDQTPDDDIVSADRLDQWGYDTDYICDDVIEKAAEDAERQFQESLKASNAQTGGECSNDKPSHEGTSLGWFHGKSSREAKTKNLKFDSRSKPPKMTKETSSIRPKSKAELSAKQNKVPSVKSTKNKSPRKAQGQVRKFSSPGKASLAVVPPKKVRKCPEQSSTAEKLGLKKGPRKAFDLSQRSLNSLTELREHGKSAGCVEPKRQKAKLISPQSIMVKRNKKMLACQDLQFYRQTRPKDIEKRRSSSNSENSFQTSENPAKPVTKPTDGDSSLQSRAEKKEQLNGTSRKRESSRMSPEASTSSKTSEEDDWNDLPQTKMDPPSPSEPAKTELEDYEEEDDDPLFLTQADPLDMDLCSQVESEIIQENRPSIVEEQVAPVQEVNQTLKCKYVDCSEPVQAPAYHCPKHNTSEKTDDHLFVRPGLPLSLQKPTKPATTKVFSTETASRTANLTKDLENNPKYPTIPKSKAQLPKPPLPKLVLPQRRPPAPLTTSSVLQPLINQNNVPLLPTSNSGPNIGKSFVAGRLPQLDQAWLMQLVLRWKYEMFDNFQQFGAPSDLCPLPLLNVPLKFSGYDDYFKVFFPLMLQNAFESLEQEWREKRRPQSAHPYKLHLQNFCLDSQVNRGEFRAWIRDKDLHFQHHPKEDDLVFLLTSEPPDEHSREERESSASLVYHMGHVFRFNRSQNTQNFEREQYSLCDLCIHTHGNLSAFRNQQVQCVIIGSFVTTLRQFKALLQLQRNPLFRPIIYPNATDLSPKGSAENIPTSSLRSLREYNRDQMSAIEQAYAMVTQPPRFPKICLIHGPPGTGKSKTIVGLLFRMLMEKRNSDVPNQNFNAKNKRNRVLVCAPSNAALDDLMKKIILEFKEKCHDKKNTLGNCGDINLVRLGAEKTIDSDVVKFSLDCQVNYRLNRAHQDHGILRQKEALDRQLDQLSRQRAMERCNKQTYQELDQKMNRLSKERQRLANDLRELRRRPQEIQRNIILESHVICCTLSTSGGVLLESAFRQLGHEPFSCVIVDEAGQSCEVETIIPLLHRCTKLVLVGDPKQLPPTVISTKAEDLGYGQSLMARLCRQLETAGQGSLILQLTVQYRMHPDICLFPSKHFYKQVLKTDRATEEARCSSDWPFQPYMVFDVTDGYEVKERESFANPQELKMVVALVKLIKSKKKEFTFRNIGIITPYRAQKMQIIEQLQREFGKDSRPSEVDTVDGFQGRQKDCIIVTCVRANFVQGAIGFLASQQRLNVTITRARFSLFILGSLRTLMENKDWNSLIQDAKKRGALFKTREENYQKDVNRILKLKTAVSHSSRPAVERHAAGSPSNTTPAETPSREHVLPPQLAVQPPQRIIVHPAVDIRPMQSRMTAPVASSVTRAKLPDPRLARRQSEESRDSSPSNSGVQNLQSRSQTHVSSSSSVTGVKRPSYPAPGDRPPRGAHRFSRDQDYRDPSTQFDQNQDAKKRRTS